VKLRTILPILQKQNNQFITKKVKIISLRVGIHKFALIESYRVEDVAEYKNVIKTLLKANLTIFFVSPYLPANIIYNQNIIYIQAPSKYMGNVTFSASEYKKFSLVYGLGRDGKIEAKRICDIYGVPLITDLNSIYKIQQKQIEIEGEEASKILFDTNYEASGRGLGDILMSTAIIKEIKEKFPDSKLTYSTRPEAKEILEGNPNIDELITKNYNKTEFLETLDNYDIHFFLGKMTEDYLDKRNQQPRIDSMAELFGLNLTKKTPEIYLDEDELNLGKEYIIPTKRNVVFCIEGVEKFRNWNLNHLKELIRKLDKKKYNIIVVGKKELELEEGIVNLTDKTENLRQLFSIIANCDLVVTTDNFVSHVAAAFGRPEIILYTTIPYQWRCKYYENAIPIQSSVKCSPCWNRYLPKFNYENYTCPETCSSSITPEIVFNKIEKIINGNFNKKRFNILDLFFEKTEKVEKTGTISSQSNNKIILISLWRMFGDCLFGIPTVRALREKYPDYKMIWATHYQFYDVVKKLPYIDNYVLLQGRVDDGWTNYLPNVDAQLLKLAKKINPEKIYNLHISPRFCSDLKKKDWTIVEYVAYELAKLEKIDTTLEYFPDTKIEKRIRDYFKEARKFYKGIIVYSDNCFSPKPKGLYNEFEKLLDYYKNEGYLILKIGHITEEQPLNRHSYLFASMDYAYYAIKYSDLLISYDSGVRNLGLTVPNSKIVSIENDIAYENKSDIKSLSKSKLHISIDMSEHPYVAYLKSKSLIEGKEIILNEYNDILSNQFRRRR